MIMSYLLFHFKLVLTKKTLNKWEMENKIKFGYVTLEKYPRFSSLPNLNLKILLCQKK